MNQKIKHELEWASKSSRPLEEIVDALRFYKKMGISQTEIYTFLQELHDSADDDAVDDRIREVADFVAGFCSPHMKVWDNTLNAGKQLPEAS